MTSSFYCVCEFSAIEFCAEKPNKAQKHRTHLALKLFVEIEYPKSDTVSYVDGAPQLKLINPKIDFLMVGFIWKRFSSINIHQ